jgi:hypothetical protein
VFPRTGERSDPNPEGSLKDKGRGVRLPDHRLGNDVFTDVVLKEGRVQS